MASRLLGALSAELGLDTSSLGLVARGLRLSAGLLGLSPRISRADVRAGLFHERGLFAAGLVLSTFACHSDEQPVHSSLAAAAVWRVLLRQLLRATVRRPRL